MRKEAIVVICAHSDDQILGPGGTLARYASEGKLVITIVLSYGETSHPHIKDEIIIKQRIKEAERADAVIGGSALHCFGLKEGRFNSNNDQVLNRISDLLTKYNPSKIFTHSIDDPHPDHRSTYHIVNDIITRGNISPQVLTFDVWNPFNLRKSNNPKLYVDITKTFPKKIRALKCFKSQKLALLLLLWSIYVRAWIHGRVHGCKFAERFFTIQ